MAAMKIYHIETIDEAWYYVFARSSRDALGYVVATHYPDCSIAAFKREFDPHVEMMGDGEKIKVDGQGEYTVAEWLKSCDACYPGCWLSNTYED